MLSNKKIDYYLKKIDSPSNKILSDTFKKLNAELQSVNLSFMAKVSLKTLFKESVRLRGRYNQYVLRNSDLVNSNLNSPIFVIGLPRSGTTYLHNLLIHFLDRDGFEFWELTEPIPYFKNKFLDQKLRKLKTFSLLFLSKIFVPNLQSMHPVKTDSYEECWHLFKHSLNVYNIDFQFKNELFDSIDIEFNSLSFNLNQFTVDQFSIRRDSSFLNISAFLQESDLML